jgi:hypothetical protein
MLYATQHTWKHQIQKHSSSTSYFFYHGPQAFLIINKIYEKCKTSRNMYQTEVLKNAISVQYPSQNCIYIVTTAQIWTHEHDANSWAERTRELLVIQKTQHTDKQIHTSLFCCKLIHISPEMSFDIERRHWPRPTTKTASTNRRQNCDIPTTAHTVIAKPLCV